MALQKGQSSLQYMLIALVAIFIIVMVWIWTVQTKQEATATGSRVASTISYSDSQMDSGSALSFGVLGQRVPKFRIT